LLNKNQQAIPSQKLIVPLLKINPIKTAEKTMLETLVEKLIFILKKFPSFLLNFPTLDIFPHQNIR